MKQRLALPATTFQRTPGCTSVPSPRRMAPGTAFDLSPHICPLAITSQAALIGPAPKLGPTPSLPLLPSRSRSSHMTRQLLIVALLALAASAASAAPNDGAGGQAVLRAEASADEWARPWFCHNLDCEFICGCECASICCTLAGLLHAHQCRFVSTPPSSLSMPPLTNPCKCRPSLHCR